jgi:predicted RNase H-like HicB family nuclease
VTKKSGKSQIVEFRFSCNKHLRYQVYLRPEPEGGYTVIVPALPGCITWGKTIFHARRMAADAIKAYVKSLRKHGEPIPTDGESLLTLVEVG